MLYWVIGLSVYALISTLLWALFSYKARHIKHKLIQYAEAEQQSYQQKADQAMHLNHTFQKFVPRQFVEHIAKQGASLELGHADEDNVAILFCDIRGFTGLSERMKPQELMNFLNSYFIRMNAPIHDNKGFIDKFIGDAIMALFDNPEGNDSDKACDSIRAAIGLRRALYLYNQHRERSGYNSVNIGIGIHFGPVIIGTVGSDDRMDTTVIGDSVNIAQRLESLAPIYDIDIIVSDQLVQTTENAFASRVIDWVRVKGRSEPLKLVEVVEHLDDAEQSQRIARAPAIQQGLDLRISGKLREALDVFKEAKKLSPTDPILKHHIKWTEHLILHGVPENWDGTLQIGAE
ncbi:adenylate/guanylate cyclase domain-containing protein [Glaciecola sp. MH2013]|uniref:adenylate/guanylate cyclase domain-containing protein n=1 Tax=Glaciecola sp. MH2013 TaxID=2785524 RepID=UPI00189F7E13|nr:adenylate/guanylate cyclase domain-containing protein [Glaciecola sp. MH2013]MBF7073747.1 adenylate/guanylate cyclase domain-containing protein [Glaciecola sp. MH2013]